MQTTPAQRSSLLRIRFARPFHYFILVAAAFFPFLSASAQSSALTASRNLRQLVTESHTVIQGSVTSVVMQPHAQWHNLMTVVVTLQVEDALRGNPGSTYTFAQAVIDRRDLQQKMGYRAGQHLLLILLKPNVYGLSSPAGMEQGRFTISSAKDGKSFVANSIGNAGLFRGLDADLTSSGLRLPAAAQELVAQPKPGPIPLDQLKSLIRTISAGSTVP